jgi:hypothetical protein
MCQQNALKQLPTYTHGTISPVMGLPPTSSRTKRSTEPLACGKLLMFQGWLAYVRSSQSWQLPQRQLAQQLAGSKEDSSSGIAPALLLLLLLLLLPADLTRLRASACASSCDQVLDKTHNMG